MKLQILDYSTHRGAAPLFKRYINPALDTITHTVDDHQSAMAAVQVNDVTHVIHSGSNLSINEPAGFTADMLDYIRELSAAGVKQMGICYGHQLLCLALLGQSAVRASPNGFEAGWCDIEFDNAINPIPGLIGQQTVWQHHFDEVVELPEGSQIIATASHTPIQAWLNPAAGLLGMQFHPEFDRDSGNQYFLNDRKFIEQQGLDVDALIKGKPSANFGQLMFDYFLRDF